MKTAKVRCSYSNDTGARRLFGLLLPTGWRVMWRADYGEEMIACKECAQRERLNARAEGRPYLWSLAYKQWEKRNLLKTHKAIKEAPHTGHLGIA